MISSAAESNNPVHEWIAQLGREKMPAFAATAKTVGTLTRDDEASFARLSKLVLQDPAMTSSILRRANSVWHHSGHGRIKTISRAVVILGLRTVGSLCLTHALVDSLGDGKQRKLVDGEMAVCFHAAAQAKGFADRAHDKAPEELFIASLLHRLGPIAFWSFGGEMVDDLRALTASGVPMDEAEKRILGFSLDDLTGQLCREWNLSGLLQDAIAGKDDFRVKSVLLSQQLARAALKGWGSPEAMETLNAVAEHLHLSRDHVEALVQKNVEEAVVVTRQLGAEGASRLIPAYSDAVIEEPESDLPEGGAPAEEGVPDRFLQLEMLSDLTALIASGEADLNRLLGLALEGIYRGVGMRRVAFATFTPDRRRLVVRYAIGLDLPQVGATFCHLSNTEPNILTYALAKRVDLWVIPDQQPQFSDLLTPEVRERTHGAPFFVMPIVAAGKPIGLIYADRRGGSLPLDQDAYTLFQQFCQQVNMGLHLLSMNKR